MLKHLWTATILGFVVLSPSAQALPAPPRLNLFDEAALLTSQQQKALESILVEHEQAAGERIVIAILKSAEGQDPAQAAQPLFEEWIVNQGQDDGTLMAIYADDRKAWIDSAYGIEILDEAGKAAIIRDFILPELKAGHPYRAVGLSLLELLRVLQSPLIESGRAEQLLQQGGLEGNLKPVTRGSGAGSWFAFVIAGVLLFGLLLTNILSAEAHFTGEGWFRPNPWKIFSRQSLQALRSGSRSPLGGIDGHW